MLHFHPTQGYSSNNSMSKLPLYDPYMTNSVALFPQYYAPAATFVPVTPLTSIPTYKPINLLMPTFSTTHDWPSRNAPRPSMRSSNLPMAMSTKKLPSISVGE